MKILAINYSLKDLLALKKQYGKESTIITFTPHSFMGKENYDNKEVMKSQAFTTYNSAKWLSYHQGITIVPLHQVLAIDTQNKKLRIKNMNTENIFDEEYDVLSISKTHKSTLMDI